MLLRMLPGILLTLALGALLSALPGVTPLDAPRPVSGPRRAPESLIQASRNTALPEPGGSAAKPNPTAKPTPGHVYSPIRSILDVSSSEPSGLMLPPPQASRFAPARQAETRRSSPESLALAVPAALAGKSVASSTALASVTGRESPGMPVCPASAPPRCPDPPAKGLYFWGAMTSFKEKQEEYGAGLSQYEHKGDIYSAGFMMDWSIDATVGLSLDYYNSQLKSSQEHDSRGSDIDGYIFNAHYESTLWEKYLLRAKLFAGRAHSKGRGTTGTFFEINHAEDKHGSTLFGAMAMIGLPLIFGDDIKLVPEFGLAYAKIKTDSYTLRTSDMTGGRTIPKRSDTSLTAPLSLEVKRDFAQSWGVITPRLNLGMTLELDDSAIGVRTFNAAAASAVIFDPFGPDAPMLVRDPGSKTFFSAGVGVDVLSRGGWDLRADYIRQWGEKYSNNVVRLELGRCF